MLSDRCLSVLSVTFVHCGQTVGRIKMKLGLQVCLGPGHIVLDGDLAPLSQNWTEPSNFRPMSCGQMAGWIKMAQRRCVRWGPSSPLKGAWLPVSGPCGQTAGLMKIPLGTEVDLS